MCELNIVCSVTRGEIERSTGNRPRPNGNTQMMFTVAMFCWALNSVFYLYFLKIVFGEKR